MVCATIRIRCTSLKHILASSMLRTIIFRRLLNLAIFTMLDTLECSMLLQQCMFLYFCFIYSCDSSVLNNIVLEGEMTAENPYGHLPATQYSSLPFYSYMTIIYVVVLIMWGMLCIQYSKEIMSVHIIILVRILDLNWYVGGVSFICYQLFH